jgi:hypothetical protein
MSLHSEEINQHICSALDAEIEAEYTNMMQEAYEQDLAHFNRECLILGIENSDENWDLFCADMFDVAFPMDRFEYHRKRIMLTTMVPLEDWEITALAMEAEQEERRGYADYTPETINDDLPF